jgi:replicative DNA helicase
VVLEKLPPYDLAAEESVVAAIMVDDEAIFRVASLIQQQDFFQEKNGLIYGACLALWNRNEPTNPIMVANELGVRGQLEAIGGLSYLTQLTTELPTAVGVEYYAGIVARDAIYRRLISAAGRIAQMAYEGGADLDSVLSRSEALLMALRAGEGTANFQHVRDLLEKFLNDVGSEQEEGDSIAYLRTGFSALDAYLGGMKRSDLLILAARPGIGKTSLALTIARNAALAQSARVAVFSMEMSADQLALRLLSAESGVEQNRLLLMGHLREDEERRVMDAVGQLSGLEIYFDDTAGISVADLRTRARRLAHERGLNLIIVDYLQLMQSGLSGGSSENRVQEISYISRSLKGIARELNVPIIACSQLSRAVESRTPHIPMLSDLRESGSIEQDADVVMFIYREDAYMRKDDWQDTHPDQPGRSYPTGVASIIIAKHRNGPTGQIDLRFHSRTTKYEDLALSV